MAKGKRKIKQLKKNEKELRTFMEPEQVDSLPNVDGKIRMKMSKNMKKALRKNESIHKARMLSNMASMGQDFDSLIYNQTLKSRGRINKKLLKKLRRQTRQDLGSLSSYESQNGPGFQMVTVFVNDAKLEKHFLVASLGNYVNTPFNPLGYFRNSDSITFYIDADNSVAEAIKNLNKKLQSPSGELMGIKVNSVTETDFILNCDQVELLKLVMAGRYDSSCGLLNLSSFHADPQFIENNTFAPLSNIEILKQVLLVIKNNMSDIHALDLSNNKLRNSAVKQIEVLGTSCLSLSAINFENNYILDFHQVRYLKALPLREIKLMGNGFKLDMSNLSSKVIKAIRKELPLLKILDGHEIYVESAIKLVEDPSPFLNKEAFALSNLSLANKSEVTDVVSEEKLKTYLEQYYALLDNVDGKGALVQAYVPTAKIELRSLNPLIPSATFEGQEGIAEFLQSWPATTHNHSSFDLNIVSMSDSEGITQVNGTCIFHQIEANVQFKRTMQIVPYNSGFCCLSDLLEIQ